MKSSGKYGLTGQRLGHSFSPRIHSLLGDYEYGLYELEPEELEEFFETTELDGFNVTIPYKETVMPLCRALSDRALKIGSVNTVKRLPGGGFLGDNTDYAGFEALLDSAAVDVSGKTVLVLGTGGASLACCSVLRDRGAEVRTVSRRGRLNYDNVYDCCSEAQLLVNATPVGMFPGNGISPVRPAKFPNLEAVFDLIYNPARTELMLQAEEAGIPAFGGLTMLVAQAAAAGFGRDGGVLTGHEAGGADSVGGLELSPDSREVSRLTARLQRETMNIALIGMPGSGKSFVGKKTALETGRELVDTDEEIEKLYGKTISEIFREEGEEGFRLKETAVLAELSKKSRLVIATGGGAVTVKANRRLLRQNSRIVFVNRPLEALETQGRPLSESRGIQQLWEERRELYLSWAEEIYENI